MMLRLNLSFHSGMFEVVAKSFKPPVQNTLFHCIIIALTWTQVGWSGVNKTPILLNSMKTSELLTLLISSSSFNLGLQKR